MQSFLSGERRLSITKATAETPARHTAKAQSRKQAAPGPIALHSSARNEDAEGLALSMRISHCGNYQGQLLIDTVTQRFGPLPKDSEVFLTFNTNTVNG